MKNMFLILMIFTCIACEKADRKDVVYKPLGDRKVFMALTPGNGDVSLSSALNKALSMRFDGPGDLNLDWGILEPTLGEYKDPDGVIAWTQENLQNKPLHLTFAPIQTTYTTLPEELVGLSWNDELLIESYKTTLNYLYSVLKNVDIQSIAIGNEVDVVLGVDTLAWNTYTHFYQEVAKEARALWPKADVGVKLTYDIIRTGRTGQAAGIILDSDALLISYYPEVATYTGSSNLVEKDFSDIIDEFPEKDIHFVEVGFPSSSQLGSSENDQYQFVCDIFSAWDQHADVVESITFVWLYDLSQETLDALVELYGIDDPAFVNFLGSLGYLSYDKKEKKAYNALVENIENRR